MTLPPPKTDVSPAVATARRWLADYLQGELDPTVVEAAERDDMLFLVVARVERGDPDWLVAHMTDHQFPFERRASVYRCLRGRLRLLLRADFK